MCSAVRLFAALGPLRFHEAQAFAGKFQLIFEHPPPDFSGRGQAGQSQPEGFDHHPAVVADFLERIERFRPVNVSGAGTLVIVAFVPGVMPTLLVPIRIACPTLHPCSLEVWIMQVDPLQELPPAKSRFCTVVP